MKASYIITQNKINVKFQTGYYPLPGGGGVGGDLSNYYTKSETYTKTEVDDIIADIPVVDTSNLVPYTGATKDVNIGAFHFESSVGFKKTGGTSSQYLMADGSVSTLPTDLAFKSDIDNLQIGGRNLMLNSKGEIASFHFPVITSEPLIEGYEYTLSGDVFGTLLGHVFINNSIASPIRESNFNSTTNYRRVSVTFIFVKNDYLGCEIYPHFYSGDKVKNIKLEKGNIATDWTPAPEDKQDRLQNISGNIGIGKTDYSATEKLDVNGNVKATGYKTPTGTANQGLKANGDVFDLNTKADLVGGKVPSSQLPSYVDDVLEFANLASFPATGESGKIYIAIDTNLTYRWGGSSYVVMSSSLALGETPSTAYRGDRGKTAYDHSQETTGNPHNTTKADIGLGNVDNTSDLIKR